MPPRRGGIRRGEADSLGTIMLNVLITSAGRRTSLVRAFQNACRPGAGKVLAADIDPLAPALYIADRAIELPRATDPDYPLALLDTIKRHEVGLVVPTIDTELLALASCAELIAREDCVALVSSEEFVRITLDKWRLVRLFGSRGIRVPKSWLPHDLTSIGELPVELFIKPRTGSAGENAFALSRDRLRHGVELVPNPMIQERILAPEMTVDCYVGLRQPCWHYVPRLRIRTVGGESIQGVTISDRNIRNWLLCVLQIVRDSGGIGPITLQAFLSDGGPVLSEINPRFGGGFPLTNAAGGRYPEWIVRTLEGETVRPSPGDYTDGVYMTRYYVEHFTQEPLWKQRAESSSI